MHAQYAYKEVGLHLARNIANLNILYTALPSCLLSIHCPPASCLHTAYLPPVYTLPTCLLSTHCPPASCLHTAHLPPVYTLPPVYPLPTCLLLTVLQRHLLIKSGLMRSISSITSSKSHISSGLGSCRSRCMGDRLPTPSTTSPTTSHLTAGWWFRRRPSTSRSACNVYYVDNLSKM